VVEDVRSREGMQKAVAQRRVVVISPREARKKIFAFIFQLSGWTLVAPSCFVLMHQDQCCKVAEESLLFIFSDFFSGADQVKLHLTVNIIIT